MYGVDILENKNDIFELKRVYRLFQISLVDVDRQLKEGYR